MNTLKHICILFVFFFSESVFAQLGSNRISPSDWSVFSESNEATKLKDSLFHDKMSIRLDSKNQAIAIRKELTVKNFRIDLDIAGEVMAGIGFRAIDFQNYHFLYFRPGYGGTGEAIQYIPIYHGALSWTLYPSYQANADTKKLEWFHARLEVKGNDLKVYVNYNHTPQLEIKLVDSDFKDGGILLRSMFGVSYFANIFIQELPEILMDWEVSDQFPRKQVLDLDPNTKSTWTSIKPDIANVVNLSKLFKSPDGAAIARTKIKSNADQQGILSFDFTGKLKIFLNNEELFYYEKNILDRNFISTHKIVVNLKKGDNDLVFITEGDATFFGKGYNAMGRLQHQNWGFLAELGKK